jgi:hypothetical protein
MRRDEQEGLLAYHLNVSGRKRPRDGGLSRFPPVIEKILPAIIFFATQKCGASGIQLTGLAGR